MADKDAPPFNALHQLSDLLGPVYGSSQICHFLYSLIRMHRPQTVVELGAGLGISTLWMAQALREVGSGHLWAIDDFAHYPAFAEDGLPALSAALDALGMPTEAVDGMTFVSSMAVRLGLSGQLSLIEGRIDLDEPGHLAAYPFADREIDLLFSDFDSGPGSMLQLLVHALPRMADTASVLIDSVPTIPTSYYLLGEIVSQLNAKRMPRAMATLMSAEQQALVLDRRYTLVHLTYAPDGHQCGTSWIKIEPFDVFPYPRVPFRTGPQ